jgi:UDP-glucose 4-epimerase
MKVLVTGGYGFIGHNVVYKLLQLGHEPIIVDIKTRYGILDNNELEYLMYQRSKKIYNHPNYSFDIVNKYLLEKIFKKNNIDCVIHLASFPRQKVVNKNPDWGSRTMSEGLLNLLELSKSNNVKKFVYISSSMVYGNFTNNTNEDYICNPEGQYGILKLAGEWLVKDYARKGHFNYTIIRPSAVYGPLDVTDRVLSQFFLQAMHDQILYVNGIHEELDFTYVDDVANGIVSASLSDNTFNKTYNITKSQSHTLYHAAELIVDIVGKGDIEIKERDLNFPSRGLLNIDRARKDFGYDPKVDIEQGLKLYYDWLQNTSSRAKKTI